MSCLLGSLSDARHESFHSWSGSAMTSFLFPTASARWFRTGAGNELTRQGDMMRELAICARASAGRTSTGSQDTLHAFTTASRTRTMVPSAVGATSLRPPNARSSCGGGWREPRQAALSLCGLRSYAIAVLPRDRSADDVAG